MPAFPPSSSPARPSRPPFTVRSTLLLLLTVALLLQLGGAITTLYSRMQDAPQRALRQLELAAGSTAHALSLWLAVPDDAAASLVLAPAADTQPLQATAHSGLPIPPPLWFSAAPAQPEQPAPPHNAQTPLAQPFLLSSPVTLEGAEYILVGRSLPDGSTTLHARPLSTLRGILARAENSRVAGAVVLHTRTGGVVLYNSPPVDALRQALRISTGMGAARPTGTPDSPNLHGFTGTIATAGGIALRPLNMQISPLPSSKGPTATSPTPQNLAPNNLAPENPIPQNPKGGRVPLDYTAGTAPANPPLGYVGFTVLKAPPSVFHQLGEVLRQSPLLWGWQCLCTMLLGWLLRRIWITWGPRDTPPSNMLACSLQAQLTATTAQLQAETAHRRHLSGQCIRLLENIRLDLGRELHDQTGQRLAALLLMLEARPPSKPPETVLQEAIPHLRHIQEDVRHLARGLRPPALSGTGLGGLGLALRSLCDEYAQAGMRVQYFDDHVPALDTERSLALYRICQEALTNAAKHAQARSVFVSLVGRGNTLTLTIEDDGQGFTSASSTAAQMPAQDALPAPTSPSTGMGLLLMRERMAQWGGQLTIDSAAGKGCTIMAELPL